MALFVALTFFNLALMHLRFVDCSSHGGVTNGTWNSCVRQFFMWVPFESTVVQVIHGLLVKLIIPTGVFMENLSSCFYVLLKSPFAFAQISALAFQRKFSKFWAADPHALVFISRETNKKNLGYWPRAMCAFICDLVWHASCFFLQWGVAGGSPGGTRADEIYH